MKTIFIYPKPLGYSGKEESAYLIINNLIQKGWDAQSIIIPAYNKTKIYNLTYNLKYFTSYLISIINSIKISGTKAPKYINLGQSNISLFRDGLVYLIAANISGHRHGVINLHGNDFMDWNQFNYKTIFFRFIAKASKIITVLGPNQRKKLIKIGIHSNKLRILDNTCNLNPIDNIEILDKHRNNSNEFVTLFLSNLIESKGYLVYLDALIILSVMLEQKNINIYSILAGKLLNNEKDKLNKIEEIQLRLSQVNNSKNIKIIWDYNVDNNKKIDYFKKSHLFCFPTIYKTEAQPRVLLEAMATGSMVLTSTVGEIPASVPKNCGLLLDKVNPDTVAKAMYKILTNDDYRCKTASKALRYYKKRYNLISHIDKWDDLLIGCS